MLLFILFTGCLNLKTDDTALSLCEESSLQGCFQAIEHALACDRSVDEATSEYFSALDDEEKACWWEGYENCETECDQ